MGLLDKVDNLEETTPAKAVAKKATPKKATPKKATPIRATAVATPKKVEAKAAKPKSEKEEKLRPTGLPEGFELAGNMPRYIGWLINFAWNFGVAIGLLSIIGTGSDPDLTLGWAGAALMIIINWLVLPIWTGRNIGEFVSRSKYVTSAGDKPIFLHAVLNNSLGFLALIGIILLLQNLKEISGSGMTGFIIGIVMILLWVLNFFFKKNSDFSQGLFDLTFSSYLVKHVSTGTETGWIAKLNNLGDFGDKWEMSKKSRVEKAALKAEEAALEAKTSED